MPFITFYKQKLKMDFSWSVIFSFKKG